ncbi:MAG: acyltransferase family protein, partial [Clostridium sp.]|nr:acyltransferase family protein [Clostridium sp.]
MKQRVVWIDIAKGIAIILVVVGHVNGSYYAAGQYLNSTLFNFSTQFIYSFHMALFMFLSGLVFHKSENRRNQIKKILLNRGVVYITFSFLWWFFKIILNSFTNSPLNPKDILLIPIFPISFMWFIYALLIMEIVQVFLSELSIRGEVVQIIVSLILLFVQAGI